MTTSDCSDGDVGRNDRRPSIRSVGTTRGGRPIFAESFGHTGPLAIVVCGIHGNEASSVVFGERVRSRLLGGWAEKRGVRVVLVQAANPDGVAARTRANERGIDLNRNFPAANFEPGDTGGPSPCSEPESRALRDLVECAAPDAIFAIHCCEPLFDWDGPGEPFAEAMAQAMSAPLRFPVERLGGNPGSLGSWAGLDLGIPVVTVEFDCHGPTDIRRQLPEVEVGLDAALRHLGAETEEQWTDEQWTDEQWTDEQWTDEQWTDEQWTGDVLPNDHGAVGHRVSEQPLRLEGAEPVRIEHVGDGSPGPVLLTGDFFRSHPPAAHAMEHVRRDWLHRPQLEPSVAICSLPRSHDLDDASRTARAILDRIDPELVVCLESDGRGDGWTTTGLDIGDAPAGLEAQKPPERPSVLQSCEDRRLPCLRLGVRRDHADGRCADAVPSPRRFAEVAGRVLSQWC